jgi:C-terminal processing protease CtpA/Prc
MSSFSNRPSAAPRARAQRSAVASLAVLFAASALPLGAQQQRVEVTRMRSAHTEPADSSERQLRRLQRQLDSLARLYNEHDDLTLVERKVVEDELGRTVQRLETLLARVDAEDPMTRASDHARIQMAPRAVKRASLSISRALLQVRESEQASPLGWIGFVAIGPRVTRVEDGEMILRYFAYPRVVSVDPSSPAQRAGIVPNDTLVAYNGDDVTDGDISLTQLLIPNARVMVRIRREGKTRDVPVIVAKAPMRIVQRRDDESRASEKLVIANVPEAPSFPRMPAFAPTPGPVRVNARMPVAAMAPFSPMPPSSPAEGMSFALSSGIGVAGAQLSTIGEGLGKALGVSSGVLVTSAPVGSPANESGLVDGDVILKVGRQSVRRVSEVMDLVGLVAENGYHAVELQVVRQRKPMTVMLKW